LSESIVGMVVSVLVAGEAHGLASQALAEAEVTLEGFKGDKHSGLTHPSGSRTPWYPRGTIIRNSRQISLVSEEELAETARALELPELPPEWIGANLLIRGLPGFTQIAPGTRLFFGRDTFGSGTFGSGAVLAVEGENYPCKTAGAEIERHVAGRPGLAVQFPKAAIHRRGLVAWVERAGFIRPGDLVHIGPPEE
jgi:MOSC domain-containing protein YiiM